MFSFFLFVETALLFGFPDPLGMELAGWVSFGFEA